MSRTYFDILRSSFPHLETLDTEFYTQEPYKSNPLRKCKILVLLGAMSNYDEFRSLESAKKNEIVKKIESGCVNTTIKKAKEDSLSCSWQTRQFVMRYNNLIHEKAHELDYTENQYLVPRVVNGEINPYRVGQMTPEEANPVCNVELQQKAIERKNQIIKLKESDAYQCEKCEKRKVNVVPVQLRSGDEGKDLKVNCLYCGFDWVIRN